MKRVLHAALTSCVTAAAVTAAGCSLFVPKLQAPRLSIVSIDLGKSDFFQQHMKVHLRVENPNNRALPVHSLTYALEIAGDEAARGSSSASFTVPPLGEAQFDMDVTANLAGTLLKMLIVRGNGSPSDRMEYHLSGRVELSSGLLRSIPFDERGSFSLK